MTWLGLTQEQHRQDLPERELPSDEDVQGTTVASQTASLDRPHLQAKTFDFHWKRILGTPGKLRVEGTMTSEEQCSEHDLDYEPEPIHSRWPNRT